MNKEDFYEYTPHISGKIFNNKKPIANQEIVFGINSEKVNKEIICKTDNNGSFSFNSIFVERDKETEVIFSEKRVSLYIITEYEEKRAILWNSTLSGFEVSDFERNNLGNLRCDLDSPITSFSFRNENANSAPIYVYSQCSLFGYFESEAIGE